MANKLKTFLVKLLFGIFFILIIFPIGLLMRLCGADYLGKNFDQSKNTYWNKKR